MSDQFLDGQDEISSMEITMNKFTQLNQSHISNGNKNTKYPKCPQMLFRKSNLSEKMRLLNQTKINPKLFQNLQYGVMKKKTTSQLNNSAEINSINSLSFEIEQKSTISGTREIQIRSIKNLNEKKQDSKDIQDMSFQIFSIKSCVQDNKEQYHKKSNKIQKNSQISQTKQFEKKRFNSVSPLKKVEQIQDAIKSFSSQKKQQSRLGPQKKKDLEDLQYLHPYFSISSREEKQREQHQNNMDDSLIQCLKRSSYTLQLIKPKSILKINVPQNRSKDLHQGSVCIHKSFNNSQNSDKKVRFNIVQKKRRITNKVLKHNVF